MTANYSSNQLASKRPWMYFVFFTLFALVTVWLFSKFLDLSLKVGFLNLLLILLPVFVGMVSYVAFGIWHLSVVIFSFVERSFFSTIFQDGGDSPTPHFALLYTTCNDFQRKAVESYTRLDYENYHIFILDDSDQPSIKKEIQAFADEYSHKTTLVQRQNRRAHKAGNVNNAITLLPNNVHYILILDSDEFLPKDFLGQVRDYLVSHPDVCFVQVAHQNDHDKQKGFVGDIGIISPTIWKYYQRYRNHFGLTPCLGHGVTINLSYLKAIGGFPEIVSEDLAFTMKAREQGFVGHCTDDIIAFEGFPDSYQRYRKRFFRWVRADIECLVTMVFSFLKSRNVFWFEKIDLFIREFKLPLTTLIVPLLLLYGLNYGKYAGLKFNNWEAGLLLIIGMAPTLPFIIELRRNPLKLFNLLAKSIAVYLSFIGNSFYALILFILRKDVKFLVTGEVESEKARTKNHSYTDVDNPAVTIINLLFCLVFLLLGYINSDFFLAGAGSALLLPAILHRFKWSSLLSQISLLIPVICISFGLILVFAREFDVRIVSFFLLGISVILFS